MQWAHSCYSDRGPVWKSSNLESSSGKFMTGSDFCQMGQTQCVYRMIEWNLCEKALAKLHSRKEFQSSSSSYHQRRQPLPSLACIHHCATAYHYNWKDNYLVLIWAMINESFQRSLDVLVLTANDHWESWWLFCWGSHRILIRCLIRLNKCNFVEYS